MSLPPSYSGMPGEGQYHYYRNLCQELKKVIHASKEPEVLKQEVEKFINASRQVQWPHEPSETYHGDKSEKAVQKVVNEFLRYIKDLETEPGKAQYEDLLNSILILETQLDQLKIR